MDDATLSQVFEVVEMVEPRSTRVQNDMMVRKWYDGENMMEALPASTSCSLASLASVFFFFGIGFGFAGCGDCELCLNHVRNCLVLPEGVLRLIVD